MAQQRRNRSGRVSKFGMCVNDQCEKYKEVQEIVRGDFVCENCGKPLTECAPPKKKLGKGKVIALIVATTIAAGIAVCLLLLGGKSTPVKTEQADSATTQADTVAVTVDKDTVVVTDTIIQRDTITVVAPTATPQQPVARSKQSVHQQSVAQSVTSNPVKSSSTLNLGYGTYRGDTRGGKPDGMGRLTFSASRQIDSRDPRGRVAEPGDYVIGEFSEGRLVQGTWYGADNVVKGSILIGK